MPLGETPIPEPQQSVPPELASLIANLATAVSNLTARVEQLERVLAPRMAKQQGLPAGRIAPLLPLGALQPPHLGSREVAAQAAGTARPETSLEDRLGSQIFNRIAIVAILIGATLFLKLAMDNRWIGPLGRVLVGLLAGAGLVIWSERFRLKHFAAFSYSLKAIGSGVLYLSLWAAFQLYHLIPAPAAFGLMLLVTLWNAWMAWAQSSEVLAAYAIAGGFAVPLLLSTGGNHQVFLFSYLLSIDVATVVLVRIETMRANDWSRLIPGALVATSAFFIGWFVSFYSAEQLVSCSTFITLFFFAFLVVPFHFPGAAKSPPDGRMAAVQQRYSGVLTNIVMPLGNAIFASLAFYSVLEDSSHHAALPWIALLFSALYLAVMRLRQAAVASAVHLSLAVLFLTIAVPLKANGRWITIGWLVEGVALLWIAARLRESHEGDAASTLVNRVLRGVAALALTLGFLGLLVVPFWQDRAVHTAWFNQRFATQLAGILALGAAVWISARVANGGQPLATASSEVKFPNWSQLAVALTVALNLVALLAGVREIDTFWSHGLVCSTCPEAALQTALSISGFFMLYGAALLAVGFWKHSPLLRWQALILLVVAIVKTFLYDVRSLSQGYRVASFLGLGLVLLGISFFYVRRSGGDVRKSGAERSAE